MFVVNVEFALFGWSLVLWSIFSYAGRAITKAMGIYLDNVKFKERPRLETAAEPFPVGNRFLVMLVVLFF